MEILCHRGQWLSPEEQNTPTAFSRAFSHHYGIETDIRDNGTTLIIAHDMQSGISLTLEEFFTLYRTHNASTHLALNIKSSELLVPLEQLITQFAIRNYGIFDMAIPDMVKYAHHGGISFYTRQSEYEPSPTLYDDALGVWMDEFSENWIDETVIATHIRNNKKVALVSPELHSREHKSRWKEWKTLEQSLSTTLSLCTDYPDEANEFFN